jgi:hypothetical protein
MHEKEKLSGSECMKARCVIPIHQFAWSFFQIKKEELFKNLPKNFN